MKRPRQIDFECPGCGHRDSRFIETNDDNTPCEPQVCAEKLTAEGDGITLTSDCCGTLLQQVDGTFTGYMKTIVKGSHDFNERERERLEKRAEDHWKRQGRDEAIATERAYLKKHGAVGGVR